MRKKFQLGLANHAAHATDSPGGWFRNSGKRIVGFFSASLLTAGIVTTGLTAGIVALGVIGAAPANATTATGYYSSGNGIDGFCINPGQPFPAGFYAVSGSGTGVTQVLTWFGTHYGPEYTGTESGPNEAGGGGYPGAGAGADPRVGELQANLSAADVTRAIQTGVVRSLGQAETHPANDAAFTNQLYAFAVEYPGPWKLEVIRFFAGPYNVGQTYGGQVRVLDRDGNQVPVGGIQINPTSQTGVTINIVSPTNETNNQGELEFNFTPTGTQDIFDTAFVTSDVAGNAAIFSPASGGNNQQLVPPQRDDARATLRGILAEKPLGIFLVGKVDNLGIIPLGGAVYDVHEIDIDANGVPVKGAYRETVVTSNGDGTNPHATNPSAPDNTLPVGVGFTEALEPRANGYVLIEVQPPPNYQTAAPCVGIPGGGPGLDNPFCIRQAAQIVAGEVTGVLFANLPSPGRIIVGKLDSYQSVAQNAGVGLGGATFTVTPCDLVTVTCTGAPVSTFTTSVGGGAPGTVDSLPPGVGGTDLIPAGVFYLVQETGVPPGFVAAPPQIVFVSAGSNTGGAAALTPTFFADSTIGPNVVTNVSDQTARVGDQIFDTISVSGTPDPTGAGIYETNVGFVLVGPIAPLTDPAAVTPDNPLGLTCVGVNFPVPTDPADPIIAQLGFIPVTGDGDVVTPPFTVTVAGCYTYTQTVLEFNFAGDPNITLVEASATSPPGVVEETTLVSEIPDTIRPAVTTQISAQSAGEGDSITDAITVSGLPTQVPAGLTVSSSLLGPVAPATAANGALTCVGVDYAGAPVAATFEVPVTANGTVTTAPFVIPVGGEGCYTYVETLNTTPPVGPSVAGRVEETVLVDNDTPRVTTQISSQEANVGDSIFDTITVSNLPTPVPAGLTASSSLLGPVAALTDAGGALTCVGVDYTGAPVAGTFEVPIPANGDVTTAPFVIPEGGEGCYTYVETLNTVPPVGPSSAGRVTETVIVRTPGPEVTTQISSQDANVGDSIFDTITVSGLPTPVPAGLTASSSLLGPVAALTNAGGELTCVGVDYTGAPVAGTFVVPITGNGDFTTAPFTVTTPGCYTYVETLNTVPPVGPSSAGRVTETVIVRTPDTPTVSTQISSQDANVGDSIFDTITVSGLPTPVPAGLTASSSLLGPVAALTDANGALTCVGVDYTGAPVAGTFVVPITGNGDFTTAPFTVTTPGCYTYVETLNTTPPVGPSTAGRVTETVIVRTPGPDVSTQISRQNANVGDTIFDTIVITGSNGFVGTASSSLLGPVPALPNSNGLATCIGVDYTGAPVAGTFEVNVNGDGSYVTAPFTVTTPGCYTYVETLNTVPPVGPSTAGRVTETVVVTYQPQVTTKVSKQRANVGDSIFDTIVVTGAGNYQGPVNWALVGPVTPRGSGSNLTCTGVNWTGAPVAATGSVRANGNGSYRTASYKVAVAGCYSYIEFLPGDTFTSPQGPSRAGVPSETVLVKKPVPGLAVTGSDVGDMTLAGLAMLTVGSAVAFATRRRKFIAE